MRLPISTPACIPTATTPPTTAGGDDGSAEWRSAVSQVGNLRADALPTASRRHGRQAVCATPASAVSARRLRAWPRGGCATTSRPEGAPASSTAPERGCVHRTSRSSHERGRSLIISLRSGSGEMRRLIPLSGTQSRSVRTCGRAICRLPAGVTADKLSAQPSLHPNSCASCVSWLNCAHAGRLHQSQAQRRDVPHPLARGKALGF
jgi:hypothetical protein